VLVFISSFLLAQVWFGEIALIDFIVIKALMPIRPYTFMYYVWEVFSATFLLIAWSAIYLFVKYWEEWTIQKSMTEKAQLIAENIQLKMLQNQLHPHFLFNTLNNIYSVSMQENASKTAIGVEKLSDFLHSILHETKSAKITIGQEITLIESYIDLQKYRFEDTIDINFDYSNANRDVLIMPMILFTFVENCFKHGSGEDISNSWIKISLSTNDSKIYFEAENSIPKLENRKLSRTGIGIQNTIKRLDLTYDKKYKLEIKKLENRYKVELTINYN